MREVNEAKEPDQVIEIIVDRKPIRIRVVRLVLDSGEEEVLITNLLDESLSIEEFKVLYFRRWGIFQKYNACFRSISQKNFL